MELFSRRRAQTAYNATFNVRGTRARWHASRKLDSGAYSLSPLDNDAVLEHTNPLVLPSEHRLLQNAPPSHPT
jgi:hypothetical protein